MIFIVVSLIVILDFCVVHVLNKHNILHNLPTLLDCLFCSSSLSVIKPTSFKTSYKTLFLILLSVHTQTTTNKLTQSSIHPVNKVSTWNSCDSANSPSFSYVLTAVHPLNLESSFTGHWFVLQSPTPQSTCYVTSHSFSTPIPMCRKSHLWTQEVNRKGRKWNGSLLFVMVLVPQTW